jgi:hypothetical protein
MDPTFHVSTHPHAGEIVQPFVDSMSLKTQLIITSLRTPLQDQIRSGQVTKMPVTKRFQPDQHLFKFIKEFGHAHKHALSIQMFANHLFQLDQILHYTWFQFSQKSLEKIQTNHATIHVKCQNLTSLAINLHYTVYVSQKL